MPVRDVYVGSDHAGEDLKNALLPFLRKGPWTVHDLTPGPLAADDDYPDAAAAVAQAVRGVAGARGILLCGSAEGVCIAANKFDGIRAGIGFSEAAARSLRTDDDGNVLCLPGRLPVQDDPIAIVQAFLRTPFAGEGRFLRRVRKILQLEEQN